MLICVLFLIFFSFLFSNKRDKSLNITKSSQNKSLNIFIDKMNNIEKQVINDKAKRCLSEKTKKNYHKYFRSKNDMSSPYNKKNIKSKDKDKNKLKKAKNFLENNKKRKKKQKKEKKEFYIFSDKKKKNQSK